MNSFEDTFVSVTELQKNTKKSLGNINGIKRKVILSNNKPKAVLLSVSEYTRLTKEASKMESAEPDEWEKKL